jgi:hypothetical protein
MALLAQLSNYKVPIHSIESDDLKPHPGGISAPDRIASATWPGDAVMEPVGQS